MQKIILTYRNPSGYALDNRWITVFPNGAGHKGRHVEIDDNGNILNGMGGTHNGENIRSLRNRKINKLPQGSKGAITKRVPIGLKGKITEKVPYSKIPDMLRDIKRKALAEGFQIFKSDYDGEPAVVGYDTEHTVLLKDRTAIDLVLDRRWASGPKGMPLKVVAKATETTYDLRDNATTRTLLNQTFYLINRGNSKRDIPPTYGTLDSKEGKKAAVKIERRFEKEREYETHF